MAATQSRQAAPGEFPWVAFDRGFLPFIFCHAAAILVSTVLNTLNLSQVSCFTLFVTFLAVSLSAVFFYHSLKVTAAGKAVLITGCDSTLGASFAKHLDELGFTVFAGCMRPECDAAKLLAKESSGRLHVVPLDVTSDQQVKEALAYVNHHLPHVASGIWSKLLRMAGITFKNWGTKPAAGLWAVVHIATWAAFGEVEWAPFSAFKRSAEVNMLGTIKVTQVFLPHLRATKGRVVSVVSLLGRVSTPARAPYCAAKAGVEALYDCLRLEMRRWGVDVVLVEPGDALTGSVEWFSEERVLRQAREAWAAMEPAQRHDYGEDHFVKTVRAVHDYTKHDKDVDTGPVLRSLTDSVVRTFPLPRYQVVTPSEWLQTLVAEHLPRSVYDILYN